MSLNRKLGWREVVAMLLAALGMVAVLNVGLGFFKERPSSDPPISKPQRIAPLPSTQLMSLGFTPEQLRQRFNDQAVARKVEYRISGVTLQPNSDESDKWLYSFTNRIGFLATTNKPRGDLRSISYMASGDGTLQSGMHSLLVLITLVHAIDPALSDETANKVALDLMSVVKDKHAPVERIVNGTRYGSGFVEGVGLIIGVNPEQ